jgi:hypothetical protein
VPHVADWLLVRNYWYQSNEGGCLKWRGRTYMRHTCIMRGRTETKVLFRHVLMTSSCMTIVKLHPTPLEAAADFDTIWSHYLTYILRSIDMLDLQGSLTRTILTFDFKLRFLTFPTERRHRRYHSLNVQLLLWRAFSTS